MRTSRLTFGSRMGLFLAAAIAVGGCSKVEEAIRGFTGGSSSNEKTDAVPSAAANAASPVPGAAAPNADVKAPASSAPAGAAPAGDASTPATLPTALADPAVASKAETTVVYSASDPVEGKTSLRQAVAAYKAQGWRDPFLSLVSSEKRDMRSDKVDLSVVTLVAIVSGEGDTFCVVEDGEGTSYILREGDPVRNGRLLRIGATSVTASQTILGYTTQVQLELIDRKDVKHG